jgi:hypothetical protein
MLYFIVYLMAVWRLATQIIELSTASESQLRGWTPFDIRWWMHGYSFRLFRIRAIIWVRTARNTAFFSAFVGFTIILIRHDEIVFMTSHGIDMADQKFAQEVPKIATLGGYIAWLYSRFELTNFYSVYDKQASKERTFI